MPIDGIRPLTDTGPARTPTTPATPTDGNPAFAVTEFRGNAPSAALGAYRDYHESLAGIERHFRLNRPATPGLTLRVYRAVEPSDVFAVVEVWSDRLNPTSVAAVYRVAEMVVEPVADGSV
jgi:hypothetical protein